MTMKKKICLLGSTGSIGTQTLQVIDEHPDLFEAYVLTANSRADLLIEQARKYQPAAVVIADESKYEQVRLALDKEPIQVYTGSESLCQVVQMGPVDIVLTALVGFSGLRPTTGQQRDTRSGRRTGDRTLPRGESGGTAR